MSVTANVIVNGEVIQVVSVMEFLKMKGMRLDQNPTIRYAMKVGFLDAAYPDSLTDENGNQYPKWMKSLIIYNQKAIDYAPGTNYKKELPFSTKQKEILKRIRKYCLPIDKVYFTSKGVEGNHAIEGNEVFVHVKNTKKVIVYDKITLDKVFYIKIANITKAIDKEGNEVNLEK